MSVLKNVVPEFAFQTSTVNTPCDDNQTDEQKTPLLSPVDDNEISITEEISLKCLNVEETAFHDNNDELNTTPNSSNKSVARADKGCFRNSHSSHDLQQDSKPKDLPLKTCIVECENGETFIADHVIMTASLGMYKNLLSEH